MGVSHILIHLRKISKTCSTASYVWYCTNCNMFRCFCNNISVFVTILPGFSYQSFCYNHYKVFHALHFIENTTYHVSTSASTESCVLASDWSVTSCLLSSVFNVRSVHVVWFWLLIGPLNVWPVHVLYSWLLIGQFWTR